MCTREISSNKCIHFKLFITKKITTKMSDESTVNRARHCRPATSGVALSNENLRCSLIKMRERDFCCWCF